MKATITYLTANFLPKIIKIEENFWQ